MTERLNVKSRNISDLRPYKGNARTHSKKQIKQLTASIEEFGFNNPLLITGDGEIIAGHGRFEAAKLAGLATVPTIVIDDLSPAQRRAYVLADNKLALNAGWHTEMLALQLGELVELGCAEFTGFSTAEIDLVLDDAEAAKTKPVAEGPEDAEVPVGLTAVSRTGDLWRLGRHFLLCGDAREAADLAVVMSDEKADAVFTDPPFNCKIDGHVSGMGKVKHREFAMACGEMTDEEFTTFLEVTLGNATGHCKDGAIAFVCIDWRGLTPLLTAGRAVFSEHKQLCFWSKSDGAGMGTFYRSAHELVLVFKVGTAPHTNTFGLGETGRYRTNVWNYPRVSHVRNDEVPEHPTPKPVALVADALRDVTRRGEVVLDPFGGGGTTLIAAQMCGRSARLIEYDPLYCDATIRRFERFTGQKAFLVGTKLTFEAVAEQRSAECSKDVA